MSVIEKTIEYFAPRSALKRKAAKLRLRSIEAASRKPRIAHWGAHEKKRPRLVVLTNETACSELLSELDNL